MAKLSNISSENFRNLENSRLPLGSHLNFFVGPNGSGKSSLLELVHLLGTGKSFRTKSLDYLIAFSQPKLLARGQYSALNTSIGIEKLRGQRLRARLAGDSCQSASDLVDKLPLVLVNADMFQLLEGGPSHRRGLLDWILFHVKQNSRSTLSKYKKVLAQRNEALKRARFEQVAMSGWDELLIELSAELDSFRKEVLLEFIPLLKKNIKQILPGFDIDFTYISGWPAESTYPEVLKSNFRQDVRLGYTEFGPHRADLLIEVNSLTASQVLSRGQSKLLVMAIKFAQASFLWAEKQTECVYLLDDLQSELDLDAQIRVLNSLKRWGAQAFITGTSVHENVLEILTEEDKLFHVEQGQIRNMPSKAAAESVEY